MSARFGRFSYGALITNSTDIHRNRSRTKAMDSSIHSKDNYRSRSCNRTTDKCTMDSHTNPACNSYFQNKYMHMTFLFSTSPSYMRRSPSFDQSLLSQSLTASSIAPLRFPFLPPSLITIAKGCQALLHIGAKHDISLYI